MCASVKHVHSIVNAILWRVKGFSERYWMLRDRWLSGSQVCTGQVVQPRPCGGFDKHTTAVVESMNRNPVLDQADNDSQNGRRQRRQASR